MGFVARNTVLLKSHGVDILVTQFRAKEVDNHRHTGWLICIATNFRLQSFVNLSLTADGDLFQ